MVNENFKTGKEQKFDLRNINKENLNLVAYVSDHKVRIVWRPLEKDKDFEVTILCIILEDGKLVISDWWGWGD
jgi:hypothetical protein